MKKTVKFLIILFLLFACLSKVAAADSKDGEYVISESNGGYALYSSEGTSSYGSIGECLGAISEPVSVRFADITTDEPIVLPRGEYEISGELSISGVISIPGEATVSMNAMTLTLGRDAYIRIKGGSLTVESSSIMGAGQLIRLDYSSSSTLKIISGSIFGECDDALINIENGRAVIRGADIENKGGAAIRSDSELCLLGSPRISGATYGIILESPMYMGAYAEEYYSSLPLAIQYTDTFSEGTLTEIFYESTERSLANISLYDKDGKQAKITHFRDCKHTSEKNFGGVYLPHTVKFFVHDKLVFEDKLLSGERVSLPEAENIVGYEFDNWYRDRDGENPCSPDKRVYSSFSVYGIYKLSAPAFTASSIDITYDGKEHILALDSLTHPLEGGYYTYTWYKDGKEISTLSQIILREASDSGTYSCRVFYNLGGDSASVYAENIKVNIKKKSVDIPAIPPVKYNGLPQYPTPDASELYSFETVSGKDAGLYPVTFTLADPDNFSWSEGSDISVTVNFEITKADNRWVTALSVSDTYIGFPSQISAVPLFGEVVFLYSATEKGVYTADAPTSVGSYYVKAVVSESSNYSSLTSSPISFSILPEEVIGLETVTPPSKTEYFAFDKFDMSGMEIAAVYNSGRREVLSPSRLTCVYNDGKGLRAGDTSVVIEYLGASLKIPVYVSPLSYDLSNFGFEDQCTTYDGNYHTQKLTSEKIIGLDGIPLCYEIYGGGRDVGEYTVSVIFSGESRDYIIPTKIDATLTILPLEVDLIWSDTQFVYDSSPKLPIAYFTDAMGVRREVTVCGSATLAGDNYSATASSYSKNYTFRNPTCQFSIAKADYDMSGIKWSAPALIYNGEAQEVVLESLPAGVSVVGYTDNRATNVGKYTATASLKYDERNYNPPVAPSYNWEIKPAQYDMSSLELVSMEYEYDGEEHLPIIRGVIPTGADGITPSYSLTHGAINVSDGEVTVTLYFTTESKNYLAPSPMTAKVKIVPKGISVTWVNDSFVYDGKIKSPTAASPLTEIKVSGGGVNAGSYTATAESLDPNYTVVNSVFPYEIAKAENFWTVEPSISNFFESGSPSPSATPHFGKAEFNYYTDASATINVTVAEPGKYFMVATVPESENYLSLSSDPISFTCIEVVAIGIRVEMMEEPKAFATAENALCVYLAHNDGSDSLIPINSVSFKYQNGDSFRCADTQVEISYGGFTKVIPVTVASASYDLSLVCWNNTEVEYDGEPHAPYLSGIPEGIEILGYIGEAGIAAGEYTFSAIISYDEENYLTPQIQNCILTVKKATVAIPSDISVEYNGSSIVLPSSPLYVASSESEIKNSGEYTVTCTLTDSNNYIFENGDIKCDSKITVFPRELRITVLDFKLYWLESYISPTYTVEGEIVDGESLDIYYYVEDEKIYAKTDNPNYSLTVEPGVLERLPYPSDEMRGKLITYALLIIILILLFILAFKKRGDIYDIICMLRAKRRHRHGTGYINNAPSLAVTDITSEGTARCELPTPFVDIVELHQRTQSLDVVKANLLSADLDIEKSEISKSDFDIEKSEPSIIFRSRALPIASATAPSPSPIANDNPCDIAYKNDMQDEEIVENSDFDDPAYDTDVNGITSDNCFTDEKNDDTVDPESEIGKYDTEDYNTFDESRESENGIKDNTDNSKASEFEEPSIEIKMEYANSAITNEMAKKLIKDEREVIYTSGNAKSIINVDTLSRSFIANDRVDVNILKKKSLVPYDTSYIKVLARGAIDKPLHVFANEFSLAAVKMILLSGGEAIRVISEKEEKNKTKR